MSDETPVERRLRGQADSFRSTPGMRWSKEEQEAEADASDCGREAIRILVDWDSDEMPRDGPSREWKERVYALLARCTEGPR